MDKDFDDALGAVRDLPVVGQVRQVIDDEIERRERAVDNRILVMLNRGEALDPQVAVQAWLERKALRDLKNALTRREGKGKSAGRSLSTVLNGQSDQG